MAWYNSSWLYRKKITIDKDKVDANLTDYPVYLDLSTLGSDFFNNVKSGGGDIRITTSDGTTEVPREVVSVKITNKITDDLEAYWKLDGNSDDEIGSNNGSDSSITYGVDYGKIGQGALLNGTSSEITLGTDSSLAPATLSWSAWIKKGENNRLQTMFVRDRGSSSYHNAYIISMTTGNKIIFEQQNGSSTPVAIESTSTITDTNWHHIVVVRNPSEGTTDFYIDGSLDRGATGNTTAINYGTCAQGGRIGCFVNNIGIESIFFKGSIDEVGLWSRALTASDVLALYNSGSGIQASDGGAVGIGEVHFKGDLSSSTDTEFYIYYGNSGASDYAVTDTYGRNNVWNSNYKAVYHLKDANDSSGNGNNGTVSGATSVDAKIGKGYSFDGSNDYISTTLTIPALSTATDFYWSCIAKLNATPVETPPMLGNRFGGTSSPLQFIKLTPSKFEYYIQGQQGINFTNAGVISKTVLQHHAIIKNGNNLRYYRNGAYTNDQSTVTSNMASNPFKIGGDPSEYSNSTIDEVRIMNINPGTDWVATENNNLMSAATFYAVGSQEEGTVLLNTIFFSNNF